MKLTIATRIAPAVDSASTSLKFLLGVHQNSSASIGTTQSAPLLNASRANPVVISDWWKGESSRCHLTRSSPAAHLGAEGEALQRELRYRRHLVVGRGAILNPLAKEGRCDHDVRPIGLDGLAAGYRPKPFLETPARHGDVVVVARYLLQSRLLVRAIGDEMSITAAHVRAEVKEEGTIVGDVSVAQLPNLSVRRTLPSEDQSLRMCELLPHTIHADIK